LSSFFHGGFPFRSRLSPDRLSLAAISLVEKRARVSVSLSFSLLVGQEDLSSSSFVSLVFSLSVLRRHDLSVSFSLTISVSRSLGRRRSRSHDLAWIAIRTREEEIEEE